MVASAILAVAAVSLYGGLTMSIFSFRMSRENLRANQVALEKMESLRVFNWDQITSNNFVPTNFYVAYAPDGTTNIAAGGLTYTGTLSISSIALPGRNYTNDVKLVTIDLNWTSGDLPRHRQISTLVSKYGLHNKLLY
jgi:hypothetical protein